MARHIIIFIIFIWHTALGFAGEKPNNSRPIQIVTSEFAPFNYIENKKPTGLSTETILLLLKKLKMDIPVSTLPWARAYQTALRKKNTLIYTIARTQEREHLFHWVGILVTGDSYLFSLKNRFIHLNSLNEALPLRIGSARNDIRAKFLLDNGILGLDLVVHSRMNAVKLLNQRIDLWAEDELAAIHTIRQLGYDPDKILKKSLPLDLNPKPRGYLAFSRDTDKHILETFKHAFLTVTRTKAYEAIKNKYYHPGPPLNE